MRGPLLSWLLILIDIYVSTQNSYSFVRYKPSYQNSTCVRLKLLLLNCFWALLLSLNPTSPRVSADVSRMWCRPGDGGQEWSKHYTWRQEFWDVPGDRLGPRGPPASWSPNASNSGGLKCAPHAAESWLMQVKEANVTDVQLSGKNLKYVSGQGNGCRRSAFRSSSLTPTSKFLFINTQAFSNRQSRWVSRVW